MYRCATISYRSYGNIFFDLSTRILPTFFLKFSCFFVFLLLFAMQTTRENHYFATFSKFQVFQNKNWHFGHSRRLVVVVVAAPKNVNLFSKPMNQMMCFVCNSSDHAPFESRFFISVLFYFDQNDSMVVQLK